MLNEKPRPPILNPVRTNKFQGKYKIQVGTMEEDEIKVKKKTIKGCDICDTCGVYMKIVNNNSLFACFKCFKTRPLPVISHSMHQEDEYCSANAATPQKNRLLEWLEFSQAKDYADPDPTLVNAVCELFMTHELGKPLVKYQKEIFSEYKKRGTFTSASDAISRLEGQVPDISKILKSIDADMINELLRHLASTKVVKLPIKYEKTPKLASLLGGFWPLRFTTEQEELIRRMFSKSSPYYEKYRKPGQPNFPGGYSIWLRSTVLLLGLDEFVGHFKTTTNGNRQHWQEKEEMRKKICEELNWQFIPTDADPPPIMMDDGRTLEEAMEDNSLVRSTTKAKRIRKK